MDCCRFVVIALQVENDSKDVSCLKRLRMLRAKRFLRDRHRAPVERLGSSVVLWQKTLGPGDPQAARCMNNLGLLLQAKGDLEQAELLLRQALAICEKALGPEHPLTMEPLRALAELLVTTERAAEAEPHALRAASVLEQTFGPEHPDVELTYRGGDPDVDLPGAYEPHGPPIAVPGAARTAPRSARAAASASWQRG
jgi:tetratricopeptide (TPR) repeat protein